MSNNDQAPGGAADEAARSETGASVFVARAMRELATLRDPSRHAHGTRARYNSKCRCPECTKANREYEQQRLKRPPNPLVPAFAVREHLEMLTSRGVGLRAVADACDVSRSILGGVRRGEQRFLRQQSAERVLQVDEHAISDGSLVPAKETWRLLRELIREGYKCYDLARRLGNRAKRPHLAISKRFVTAATALKVKRLHTQLLAAVDASEPAPAPEPTTPRARILRAIRFFDWVSAEELCSVLEVPVDERNTWQQALGRLAKSGEIQRRRIGRAMPEYAPRGAR